MEVQMARIDPQSLGELSVRELLLGAGTEHFEDAQAKRMPERFQLLGPVDRQRVTAGRL